MLQSYLCVNKANAAGTFAYDILSKSLQQTVHATTGSDSSSGMEHMLASHVHLFQWPLCAFCSGHVPAALFSELLKMLLCPCWGWQARS